jgi:hypothetical protein
LKTFGSTLRQNHNTLFLETLQVDMFSYREGWKPLFTVDDPLNDFGAPVPYEVDYDTIANYQSNSGKSMNFTDFEDEMVSSVLRGADVSHKWRFDWGVHLFFRRPAPTM